MQSLGGNIPSTPNDLECMVCGNTITPATAAVEHLPNSLLDEFLVIPDLYC